MPRYHPAAMARTTRSISLLVCGVLLIALLLVLVPNLHRIEFAPGRPIPLPTESVEQAGNPSVEAGGAGAMRVLLRVLLIAALTGLAIIVVGSIFLRELRPYLVLFGAAIALILILHSYLSSRMPRADLQSQVVDPAAAETWTEGRPLLFHEEGEAAPPSWTFTAAAIGISAAVAVLLVVAWKLLAPRWRRRSAVEAPGPLQELLDTVGSAADEIRLGGDPRSAVLRCYREMIRILCRQQTIDHVHMTARELARALHRAGFTARHVGQLTEIFELVRYGQRTGDALARDAVDCLEAIRKAYAT